MTEFDKILTGWSIDRRAAQPGGGAVAGGRIAGTWPSLGQSQLFENRDLAPTTDLRAVALGLLGDHLGVPASGFASIFPGSSGLIPTGRLIRA